MNKTFCKLGLSLALLLCTASTRAQHITVSDAANGTPVDYATVYDKSAGTVLGFTDIRGQLDADLSGHDSLTVHHINYEPLTLPVAAFNKDGGVKLQPRSYGLNEVVVKNNKGDLLRMKVYARQVTVMNSQPTIVAEVLFTAYADPTDQTHDDYVEPKLHVLSKQVIGNKKLYADMPFVMSVAGSDIKTPLQLFLPRRTSFYQKMMEHNGRMLSVDKKTGKEGDGVWYMHDDKERHRCTIVLDSLFDKEPAPALWGNTITHMAFGQTYDTSENLPSISNLQNSYFMYTLCKEKKGIKTDITLELYVLESEYISKEQQKKDKKQKRTAFVRPAGIPPFDPVVAKAMQSMKKL